MTKKGILIILLAALPIFAARGYEDVSVNCGNPDELARFQKLKSERRFDAPRNMWDDCVENGNAYTFTCRVDPEFGIFCHKGKRSLKYEPKKLEAKDVKISTRAALHKEGSLKFKSKPPKREGSTAQQLNSSTLEKEIKNEEKGFFEGVWGKIKGFVLGGANSGN